MRINEIINQNQIGLVTTPKDLDQVYDWIELHEGAERTHLYTLAGMIFNYLGSEINEDNINE